MSNDNAARFLLADDKKYTRKIQCMYFNYNEIVNTYYNVYSCIII